VLRRWLDGLVLRGPFRGRDAARYLALHRQAFGDLDDRLVRRLAAAHPDARVIADVGAGDGRLTSALGAALPGALAVAVEPSADLATRGVRAVAERLPFADGSVDLAVLLSSLRHVEDRGAALRELRRVARAALILELDPDGGAARRRRHEAAIPSWVARLTFGPVVLGLAPRAVEMAELAEAAGWRARWEPDPSQPFYWMWLS
jgi:ubiquinone/menaquinone biosynthesis C-methylase UbiE